MDTNIQCLNLMGKNKHGDLFFGSLLLALTVLTNPFFVQDPLYVYSLHTVSSGS